MASSLTDRLFENRSLIVLANRAPIARQPDGSVRPFAGGFASPMLKLATAHDGLWIGAARSDSDRGLMAGIAPGQAAGFTLPDTTTIRVAMVSPPQDMYDRYYAGMANGWLWPIAHRLMDPNHPPSFDAQARADWDAYRDIQQLFADEVVIQAAQMSRPPLIMIEDYHLFGVASRIRAQRPDALIQLFDHIPWAPPEYWRVLPHDVRREIANGLLGADVVGFQARRDASFFGDFCRDAGHRVDVAAGSVAHGKREVAVRVYPIGPDLDREKRTAADPKTDQEQKQILAEIATPQPRSSVDDAVIYAQPKHAPRPKVIFRADRVEPSKNIIGAINGFEKLLADHPQWRGKVVLWQFLQVTRQDVPVYREHYYEIMEVARRVNDRFGTEDWTPIRLDGHAEDALPRIQAGFRCADVLAMLSHWDGMNLTISEGVMGSRRNPAVMASTHMGAYELLANDVIPIDPASVESIAFGYLMALTMPLGWRREHLRNMRTTIAAHDSNRWANAQINDLAQLDGGMTAPGLELGG